MFIKWVIDKAEGFEYRENRTGKNVIWHSPHKNWTEITGVKGIERGLFYPLLLQRAIEGVNKSSILYFIKFDSEHLITYEYGLENPKYWSHYGINIDTAKESALKYIYEQEKSNGST